MFFLFSNFLKKIDMFHDHEEELRKPFENYQKLAIKKPFLDPIRLFSL